MCTTDNFCSTHALLRSHKHPSTFLYDQLRTLEFLSHPPFISLWRNCGVASMASAGEKSSPYNITQGLEVLYSGEDGDATVDIIAVPGLGSNPDTAFDSFKKTSDGRTQFNWLTDGKGLRDKFPTARVLLYKAESRWIKEAAVNQSIKNLASNLLTAILSKREGIHSDRPIIFVGHSMGGLIVAKAITLAAFRSEDYPNVLPCITGCLFFGTPFQGSAATGKAIMLARLLKSVNQAAVSRVLNFLVPGNDALDELRNDFARICNEMEPRIGNVCFYELSKTNYAEGNWMVDWIGKVCSSHYQQTFGGFGLIAYS